MIRIVKKQSAHRPYKGCVFDLIFKMFSLFDESAIKPLFVTMSTYFLTFSQALLTCNHENNVEKYNYPGTFNTPEQETIK